MDSLTALRETKAHAEKLLQWSLCHLPDPYVPLSPGGHPFVITSLPSPETRPLDSRMRALGVSAPIRRNLTSLVESRLLALRESFSEAWKQSTIPLSLEITTAVVAYLTRLEADTIQSLIKLVESKVQCSGKPSFNTEYVPFFEKYFEFNAYPSLADRRVMACKSMMTPRQIEVWFQNRRAKAKKDGTPLRRMTASDPPPDWRSLEDLKDTMKLFYIPESERSAKHSFEEDTTVPDLKPHELASPLDNPLNPPEGHRAASNGPIPKFRHPPSISAAFTYSFRTCAPKSTAPSSNCSNVHQAIDDLSSTFMSLSLFTSKPRSFDTSAATAAFTYDCSKAPHCALATKPKAMEPLDLDKVRFIRQPAWKVPHVEAPPVLPPRVDAPIAVHASSPTRRVRKRAPLPRRVAPRHSTPPSRTPSLSHSRRSSYASSSPSSSAPSTPEQLFPLLPVAIAPPDSSGPVRRSFGAFASQKSLLIEKIEQHKRQQVLPPLEPPPPYYAHPEDAPSGSLDHMLNTTQPTLSLSNGLYHQSLPRIPLDISQSLSSFPLPSPVPTIQDFSLFSGTDFSTPPSNPSFDIPDLFNFDAELGDFMGTLLGRGDILSLDGGLEEPSFDSIEWGTAPQPQELLTADLSAPFLHSSSMPGTAPDFNTLISSY